MALEGRFWNKNKMSTPETPGIKNGNLLPSVMVFFPWFIAAEFSFYGSTRHV
jgi:hypothetical protein